MLMKLTNLELLASTKKAVSDERSETARVLEHLREIECRMLHLELGCSSLHHFCMRELGYSEFEAHARVSAMRLSRDIPEIMPAVEQGRHTLTNLMKAQSFFKQKKMPIAEKKELLMQLEGKSTRECERILAEIAPGQVPQERSRIVSATQTQISFVADEELMADLEKLRALWGNQDLNYAELIKKMARMALAKADPARQKQSPCARKVEDPNEPPVEMVTPETRHIPVATRREVWRRDGGRCTYVHEGRRCESIYALQFDHLVLYSHGGSHAAENLRLLCRAHHRLRGRAQGAA
jgi:hypothetical protein